MVAGNGEINYGTVPRVFTKIYDGLECGDERVRPASSAALSGEVVFS